MSILLFNDECVQMQIDEGWTISSHLSHDCGRKFNQKITVIGDCKKCPIAISVMWKLILQQNISFGHKIKYIFIYSVRKVSDFILFLQKPDRFQ